MDMEVRRFVTLKISQDILSSEAPVGAEEDSKLGDFIQDDETISNRIDKPANSQGEYPRNSPISYSSEAKIIEMRFGLRDGIGHTLEEVGRVWRDRERIRQIGSKSV